ncbi:GspE/PulE family protein [Erythrobacter aureus]|nr:ATPase, T2SS/T4P/T4SS family [Erythrobacter aureus]
MGKQVIALEERGDLRERLRRRAIGDKPRAANPSSASGNIAHYLVENELLDRPQARAAQLDARARGVPVATILSEQGSVPREKIIEAIENIDTGLLAGSLEFDVRLPRRDLRELKIICHAQSDKKLFVSSITNMSLVRQRLAPYLNGRELVEVEFSWAKWNEFEPGIDRIIEPGVARPKLDDDTNPRSVIADSAADAEVLELLIDFAALNNVSDIHIEPQKTTYRVYFRHLGKRQLGHSGSIEQYNRLTAMIKDRAQVDPMETRIPLDGSFPIQIRGRGFDVRVATVPTDGREKLTLRLLDPQRAQMPLTQLGISEVDEWRSICGYRNGLVLIVGATGSGKTTTLNATVREMPRVEKSIYTAEDPVEYRIPGVTHVQMNDMVGLDFAKATRAFMRNDPDVIILGEIRDNETASKAIQAAETGHLVIATIHAESVPMALQRLKGLDVKLEDFEMLLRGVMVQFLLRTLCSECHGEGCEECFQQGYGGRTVVSEIARVRTPADVRKMMSPDEKDHYWRPLWKDLESKLEAGVTDGAEIYRTFASELDVMADHSKLLAKVLAAEKAKRDVVTSNVELALVANLPKEDKKKARRLAEARLLQHAVDEEEAEADAASSDGEPLGSKRKSPAEKPEG